jgi:hypothetical protein
MFSPASFGDVTTWYVSVNGDNNNGGHSAGDAFRTIGKAIEEAIKDAEDEQEIIVLPGTYMEGDLFRDHLDLLDVHIYAEDGPAFIDATSYDYAFSFENGETNGTVIEGFQISGADEAGIKCNGASPVIRNCEITNNTRGVQILGAGSPTIDQCEISYSTGTPSNTGNGVDCLSGSPVISDCTITNNERGVYVHTGHLSISGTEVAFNSLTVDSGAGIYLYTSADADIEDCHIHDNAISGTATTPNESYGGGGIAMFGGEVNVLRCEIHNNRVEVAGGGVTNLPSVGGGIYSRDSAPDIEYCKIHHNTANSAGGGVYFGYTNSLVPIVPEIHWSEITCNEAPYREEPPVLTGDGGGIYIDQGNTLFPEITHTVIAGNRAYEGGGIYTPSGIGLSEEPVDCYPYPGINGRIVLDNCLIVKNIARGGEGIGDPKGRGGAIFAALGAQFEITNCTFSDNDGHDRGGAMFYSQSCCNIFNSIFWDDTATFGPELYLGGGSRVGFYYTDLAGGLLAVGKEQNPPNFVTHSPDTVVYTSDPHFREVEVCDYHLTQASLLLDAGTDGGYIKAVVDLDTAPRVIPPPPSGEVDPGCYELNLVSIPVDGTVDARQPHEPDESDQEDLQGIGHATEPIQLQFISPVLGLDDPVYWSLCESGTHGYDPNEIVDIDSPAAGIYTFELLRPISPGEVTRITYVVNGSYVEFISHPGNANADGEAEPFDVTSIVNYFNQTETPPAVPYSTDIDHSAVFDSFDVLRLLDLLNGGGDYDVWNGTPKPDGVACQPVLPDWCDCTPGAGEGGALGGQMASLPQGAAVPAPGPSLGEVFAEYLANVDLAHAIQAEGYPLLVDGFCYWTIETLPLNERQALACRLTDPEFVCLSEAVREDLPEIAARLTE